MSNIADIVGLRKVDGCLGLEIETEAERPYDQPVIDNWTVKPDGSLRDFGLEYISRSPVKRDGLKKHLTDWKDGLGNIHGRLRRDSISTSVHVHVNVLDMNPVQVLNFYLTGILLEGVMSRFAGPDRCGNLFCLRTRDAEHQFNSIKRQVAQISYIEDLAYSFNPNDYKYSNINLVPITRLGSMEFRVMRGTTDIDEIRVWSEAVHDLREFAKSFDTPVDFLRNLKDMGPDGLLKKVLGDNADTFKYPNYEKDITKNYIYLADMASCRKSWELPSNGMVPKKSKKPYVEMNWAPAPGAIRPMPPQPEPQAVVNINWDEDFEEEDM